MFIAGRCPLRKTRSKELEPLYARFHARFPKTGKTPAHHVFQVARTLLLVCCLNLFDCCHSLADTFRTLLSMLTVHNWNVLWDGSLLTLGLTGLDYGILAAGVVVMLCVSLAQRSGSVRDQIGIAPLFYTVAGSRLIFASEIKPSWNVPG